MSDKTNKYQNAKIYKIVSNVSDDVYYGSTCSPLSQRLSEHRSNYKRFLNGKFRYVTSYKILESDNYDIVLVENYPCNNREELHSRERYFIDSFNCVNKNIPTQTQQEWAIKHRESHRKSSKVYYETNKHIITEKHDCVCGSEYTTHHKARHLKTKRHLNYIASLQQPV